MLLRLKSVAFQAQQCYQIAWMLANFIYDQTGEKMHEPDDIMDGDGHGAWKKQVYGDPFDYTTIKTQKEILDKFLIDRPFRAGIIFEGETEKIVIESILKSLRVNKERDGFFIYNAQGQSNIAQNLNALYDLANLEKIDLFIITDNDGDATKIKNKLSKKIKSKSIRIWKGDFEEDNFGVDAVLHEVNTKLKDRKLKRVEKTQVTKMLNRLSLMRAIDTICKKENGRKLDDLVSKKMLAKKLLTKRLREIEKERTSSSGWKPKLPIEKFLKDVFQTMPRTTFSFPSYD